MQRHEDAAVGLVAALGREVGGCLRRMAGARRERVGSCVLRRGSLFGVPIVLAVTGMGAERARHGVRALLERAAVGRLLSLGFAGALTEDLVPGALALPETLVLDDDPPGRLTADARLRADLGAAAAAAGLSMRSGPCVTAPRMVTLPEARAALAGAYGAELVDMEGYWLAREAGAAGVAYASVRAVSDGALDHHPVLADAVAGGRMSALRLLRGYAAHPAEAAKLPRLVRGSRAAAAALDRFVAAALPALAREPAA